MHECTYICIYNRGEKKKKKKKKKEESNKFSQSVKDLYLVFGLKHGDLYFGKSTFPVIYLMHSFFSVSRLSPLSLQLQSSHV